MSVSISSFFVAMNTRTLRNMGYYVPSEEELVELEEAHLRDMEEFKRDGQSTSERYFVICNIFCIVNLIQTLVK